MMLYFAVPLILMQILLCSLCYPQVVRHYREKTDYSMEQSVSQAISFTESYLRNMTYLANMVEDQWGNSEYTVSGWLWRRKTIHGAVAGIL